jgi:hypothetical protein
MSKKCRNNIKKAEDLKKFSPVLHGHYQISELTLSKDFFVYGIEGKISLTYIGQY